MKKPRFPIMLALLMCLLLIPATALAEEDNSISVIVTKTAIKTDSVVNVEGYASLTLFSPLNDTAKYALVDSSGNFVFAYGKFPCSFDYLYKGLFDNGIVSGQDIIGYSLFDLSGKQIIPDIYTYLEYANGYALAIKQNSADDNNIDRFIIDKSGQRMLTLPTLFNHRGNATDAPDDLRYLNEARYGSVNGYGEGLLWFTSIVPIKNNISEANTMSPAKDVSIEMVYSYYSGGAHCGFIDLSGKVIIPQQYSSVQPFFDGLAGVENGSFTITLDEIFAGGNGQRTLGKWGYIDKTGQVIIDFQFTDVGRFTEGYARVAKEEGKYGYIDKSGKTVIPLIYDSAFGAGDGLFSVGNIVGKTAAAGVDVYKYGFIDINGNVVVPLEYDDVCAFIDGVAYAIKDGDLYILKIADTLIPIPIPADTPSDWAKVEVNAAIKAGLVPDNLQKNYTKPVSRGDVAQMFINLLEKSSATPIDGFLAEKNVAINTGAFSDTADKAVLAANALGILNGIGGGRFDPQGTLTRAQIAAIINRVARALDIKTAGYTHSFTDVAGHWVDEELGWPVHAAIVNGIGDNKYNPHGQLTTEQAIAITYRALQAFL